MKLKISINIPHRKTFPSKQLKLLEFFFRVCNKILKIFYENLRYFSFKLRYNANEQSFFLIDNN